MCGFMLFGTNVFPFWFRIELRFFMREWYVWTWVEVMQDDSGLPTFLSRDLESSATLNFHILEVCCFHAVWNMFFWWDGCDDWGGTGMMVSFMWRTVRIWSLKTLSVKVTVVVTMCANEMEIRGAPKNWARYFQQEKVFHIKCHLEDTTLKPPHRWEERIPDLVASCLEQWKIVCGQLWKQSMLAVTRGESMHVLFHCFGGINRSAGALCAWLVVGYNYSAEDAVQLLLEKRPSLRPWHNRPYVLKALWKLEGLRTEWHMELSAADGNWFAPLFVWRNCSWRTCKISSQLLFVCTVEKCWSTWFLCDLTRWQTISSWYEWTTMHDRAIWNFRGGSCASLVPAWDFDGCFWSWSKSNYWNVSSAVLCTKVGTSEPRRFTAISKHHFVLVCVVKASACKSACV